MNRCNWFQKTTFFLLSAFTLFADLPAPQDARDDARNSYIEISSRVVDPI